MNEDKQQKKPLHPDVLKWVIIGLLAIVVIVLVLGLGIFIGEKRVKFSYRWAEQYHKMFAGPKAGFFADWRSFPRGEFIEAHGVFGEIIEIKENEFVIKGRGDVEKVILITDKTIIQKGRETVKKEDLKVGDWMVIIGSPNEEGQIEAKLIRVFAGKVLGVLPARPLPIFR